MSYDYLQHFNDSAKVYVDKHKHDLTWVEEMINYYKAPGCEFRLHTYTYMVLDLLHLEYIRQTQNPDK